MQTKRNLSYVFLLASLFMLFSFLACAQAEASEISGLVWLEKTVDGSYNNENGFADAQITLEQRAEDGAILPIAAVNTGKDGKFVFSVPGAGEYRLKIELPKDYQFTLHGTASSALPAQGNLSATPFFTLADGQYAVKNIGVTKSSSYISLIAFEDENANGGRMQSEPVVRDVLTELVYEYDGETYLIASSTTDRSGETSLRKLSPGTYRLRVTLPDNRVVGPIGQKINQFYNCVIAQEGNTGLSEPFHLDAKSSLGMGIGVVRTGNLSGKIWLDDNYNGSWDGSENGLTDATILLISDAVGITREATVEENGNYLFSGLQPGAYRLEIHLPSGMIFTYPGQSLISDIADHAAMNVNIQVDTTTDLGPIGAMPAAAMAVAVYQDENLNGIMDDGENALPGAIISASQGGKIVAEAISDDQGMVYFSTLRSGDVTLNCSLPSGYAFTFQGGDSILAFSEAISSAETVVTAEGTQTRYTIGATQSAAISGVLFEDPANTGLYQNGYALLPGFTVQAVNADGLAVLEARTDENGVYTLSPLMPGEYTVRFLLADPYIAAPYALGQGETVSHILTQTPDYGETEAVSLMPGQMSTAMDGGVFRAGVIDGYVLLNQNHDGLATNEGGMPQVTVTLLDEYGAPYSEYSYGVTDENGYYMIKGVLPGSYSLMYTLPEDAAFAHPLTEQPEIESEVFSVTSGTEIHMSTLGAVHTSTLSGWLMANPVPAHVTLVSQTFGTVYETESWEDGQYILSGLRPDTYLLEVTLPEGYVFGRSETAPISFVPSHQASAIITLGMGEDMLNADLLVVQPAMFAGVLFNDSDVSGTRSTDEYGAEEREITLWAYDQQIALLTTDSNGVFGMEGLVPGEYMLRLALYEDEILIDNGTFENGEWQIPIYLEDGGYLNIPDIALLRYATVYGQLWSLDGTMNGVANIPVTLLDGNGNVLLTATTNNEGEYAFGQLRPGDYALSAVLPDGYLFAREQDAQERASCVISLPDGTAQAILFHLPMGEELTGMDIGMGAMGKIGDRAWLDENKNGMQDLGEPNMPGIVVELYQRGEFIASATTDVYGMYSLSGLYPGEYEMKVIMHEELKPTTQQTEFPLVASIMPEGNETIVNISGIIVPSGGQTLHYDLGFQLRKDGKYPAAMNDIPTKDWRPYSDR